MTLHRSRAVFIAVMSLLDVVQSVHSSDWNASAIAEDASWPSPPMEGNATARELTISVERSCAWHVVDQTIKVETPAMYEFAVEKKCPWARQGANHEDVCTICEGLDNPCAGEFVACTGCCKIEKANRFHSCDHIKTYLLESNDVTLKCDRYVDEMIHKGHHVTVQEGDDTANRDPAKTLKKKCEVKPVNHTSDFALVPLKAKFDCNHCAVQGVPDLLQECCERAEKYYKDEVDSLRRQGVKLFLWADGCHDSEIGPVGRRRPFNLNFPNLKEEKINKDVNAYIEETYCSTAVEQSSDQCPESGGYGRRLDMFFMHSLLDGQPKTRRLKEDCPWLNKLNDKLNDELSDSSSPIHLTPILILMGALTQI